MEAIQSLIQYNWITVVTALITGLVAFKFLCGLFEWFIKKFGIETKAMREKRENKALILNTVNITESLATNLEALQDKHDSDIKESKEDTCALRNDIEKLTDLFIDKQISDYRWEIINLADKISNGKKVSKECFKHAIATHTKYEAIIAEHGLTNGEVEISMEIINNAYKKALSDGAK